MEHGPAHVTFYQREHPVAAGRGTFAGQEQEENRKHEDAGERDAERDQNTELSESARPGEHQRQKADRGSKRAKKNRFAKIFHRFAHGRGMILAVITRLLVTAENKDREIDSEPDEDRAEADGHHVELAENQEPGGQRDEAAEEQRNSHAEQWQPAAETGVKNSAHEKD